jgi:hypothetical protein
VVLLIDVDGVDGIDFLVFILLNFVFIHIMFFNEDVNEIL